MRRILVIEDDAAIRSNLVDLLEAEGFETTVAPDGRRGIEAALLRTPDLVLCDVMMPEIDGHGVLEALRSDPRTAAVPFIFLTARTDRSEMRSAMGLGADDYLTKPFSRVELLDAVRSRLRRQEAVSAAERVRQAEVAHPEAAASRADTDPQVSRSAGAARSSSVPPEEYRPTLPGAGEVIDGKLSVLRLLGEGGMGAVFEAVNQRTGRRVAVKVLRAARVGAPEAVRRFQQEALSCGRIEHPNVVAVFDAGVHQASPYIVMELLRGETLGARIARQGSLPIPAGVRALREALAGVGAAHRAGIVHRDLQPDNLFLARTTVEGEEVVKVLDFGASKLLEDEGTGVSTRTGFVLGTPHYMSPEQARGEKNIDARADLYALGAVLYHALTGRLPVEADNYNALLLSILTTVPTPLRQLRPDLPERLEAIVGRAMAKARELRYQTAEEFSAALAAL